MPSVAELAAGLGELTAKRIRLQGHVQGVGFRPFVYRLAKKHGLTGHVRNQLGEVEVLEHLHPGDAGQLAAVQLQGYRFGAVQAPAQLYRPGGRVHVERSSTAPAPSGITLSMLAASPPPVMWLIACTSTASIRARQSRA